MNIIGYIMILRYTLREDYKIRILIMVSLKINSYFELADSSYSSIQKWLGDVTKLCVQKSYN